MKKIKNKKSIAKEKNNSYNNEENVIFQKLPEVTERNKKAYVITFISIFVIMYSGWVKVILNNLGITSIPNGLALVINMLLFFISIAILFVILKDTFKRDIKYFKRNMKAYIKYGISTLIVFGAINTLVDTIIIPLVGDVAQNEAIVKSKSLLYQIVLGVILAPIVEEGLFRGLLKKIFKNKYAFLVISSVFFGAMHITFDIANPMELLYIFSYSISGLALAYNYEKTDNLVSTIAMHMINNFFSVVLSII